MKSILYHLKWIVILFSRKIKDFGLYPIVGYVLIILLLFVIPGIMMRSRQYFEYIYSFMGLYFLIPFGNNARNEFLQNYYKKQTYRKIRLSENLLLIIPFVITLLVNQFFILSAITLMMACAFSFIVFKQRTKYVIHTPFYKRPFEFVRGFRFSFPIFLLVYGVIVMAIIYDNFNLGMVCLILILFVLVGYYFYTEPEYYVWVDTRTPKQFLLYKIKTAILFSFYVYALPMIALGIFYPTKILFVLLIYIASCLYLTFIIVLKYAKYPKAMDVMDEIKFVVSIMLPIVLIFLLPIFYKKASLQLKHYL